MHGAPESARRARALTALAARLSRADWRPEAGDCFVAADPGVMFEHRFTRSALEDEARAAGLSVLFHDVGEVGRAVLVP